jgi:hypothetical protein
MKSIKDRTIVFKTKNILREKGKGTKINRGILCPSNGVKRQRRLNSINNLLKKGINFPKEIEPKKYIIKKIEDKTKYIILGKKEQKVIDKITDIELCIELEFLLRHLDKINYGGKKYFFSTLEDVFYGRLSKFELQI